jgi:hypothetical protein
VINPGAAGVVNGIGDGRGGRGHRQFADTGIAQRASFPRRLADDVLYIKRFINGGELKSDPVLSLTENEFFPQSIANTLVHTAFILAFKILGMDNCSC